MITIVPPGKRGVVRRKPEAPSTIAYGLQPNRPRVIYYSGSRPEDTRDEAATKAVALAQPHRKGDGGDLSGTALGRFCKMHWSDGRTMISRYDAGSRYAELVDSDRVAQGLAPRQCGLAPDGPLASTMTEEQFRAYVDLCRIKREDAEAVMVPVAHGRRAVNVIYALAYEDRDLAGRDHGVAVNALYRLAVHFGLEKVGFHG